MFSQIPEEFDTVRGGHGFTMAGWNFTTKEVADAVRDHRMLNPGFELGSNVCPLNCAFCFTEDNNPEGLKRALAHEMPLERRLRLIDEAAELGCRTINFIGAGEPTIDPHFWTLLAKMRQRSITPIVYTEATLRLTDRAFAERLYQTGATVVVKVNSLKNAVYQDAIVAGHGTKRANAAKGYTEKRNRAIDLLMQVGFNSHEDTRLAMDVIMCRENADEIMDIHRYARTHNIFVLFVNYLPSGRSKDPFYGALTRSEQFDLYRQMAEYDEREFGVKHRSIFPYAGGVPCTIRGLGLYVKIKGPVFDCPGESEALGDVMRESLAQIWERARHITEGFDGGCHPREAFWRANSEMIGVVPVERLVR